MTVTIRTSAEYDPTLPTYVPPPVDATNLLWRFTSATAGIGALASWTSDAGTPGKTMAQATTAERPTGVLVSGKPVVRFAGAHSIASTQTALTKTITGYVVLKPSVIGATQQVFLTLGGLLFSIVATTGQLRISGSSGSLSTTTTLTAGTKYAVAFTVNGDTTVRIAVGAESITGGTPPTIGALTQFSLGRASTFYYSGDIEEAALYGEVHTAPKIAAQLDAYRAWYGAV